MSSRALCFDAAARPPCPFGLPMGHSTLTRVGFAWGVRVRQGGGAKQHANEVAPAGVGGGGFSSTWLATFQRGAVLSSLGQGHAEAHRPHVRTLPVSRHAAHAPTGAFRSRELRRASRQVQAGRHCATRVSEREPADPAMCHGWAPKCESDAYVARGVVPMPKRGEARAK